MSDIALDLRNITKMFGDFKAVDDVSLEIPAGSIYGFLGPNGSGKTTTIRIILEIIKPTKGTVSILGNPSALKVRDRIGYLPEEKGLYKKMKAWSVIAYFASLKGIDRRTAKTRAYELLERYGLKGFADAKTEALSKGMGQKVQVLASIAHDPDFVILDEPFSGLDPVNQQVLEEVIRDMSDRKRTILFSTHVMQHAERLCDRILLISKGKKVFDGTIPEARRTVPHTVRLETDDDISALSQLDEVLTVNGVDHNGDPTGHSTGAWELELRDGSDPQRILEACFHNKVRLRQFDHSEPSLHDVFVRLVGPDAREAAVR